MSQTRDLSFHPSSPPSEGGADSYKHEGTPDTRLTAFSPLEDSSKSSRIFSSLTLNTGKAVAQPVKFEVPSGIHHVSSIDRTPTVRDKDPFITSTPEKMHTRLSATASDFHPLSATPAAPIVANGSSTLNTPKPLGWPATAVTTANTSPYTGMRIFTNGPLSNKFSRELKLSRSLRITSAVVHLTVESINEYFTKLQNHSGIFERYPDIFPCSGATYIRATNIRDAMKILNDDEIQPREWRVEVVTPEEINKATCIGVLANENEGLHSVMVVPIVQLREIQIEERIRNHFKHYDIFALVKQSANVTPGTMQWVMEWSDVNGTWACALYLYNSGWINVDGLFWILLAPYSATAQDMHLWTVSNYRIPDLPASNNTGMTTRLATQLDNLSLNGLQQPIHPAGGSMAPVTNLASPAQTPQWPGLVTFTLRSPQPSPATYQSLLSREMSPASSNMGFHMMNPISPPFSMVTPLSPTIAGSLTSNRTTISSPRPSQGFYRSNDRRQYALRVNRGHFSPPGPHHNHVDINKIREGTDVRTTIMLRNIPNKVDQTMLKNIVDESSWGKYDFMYLRIDFANDCNVGYAFINFVDPLDIIDFVNARGNQRWNCFKSDKIAEVSYATIQGKDCLVQKFRNSSVMLEASHYRPKLYYTSNGPTPQMAGNEEPFPEPDNQSKMKRSCENAEHVGLFTPNAGQHFRDEQRRRRSQYDRGTRLAALEEGGDFGVYTTTS